MPEARFHFVSMFRSEISGGGELDVEIGGETYFVCDVRWADLSSHWGGREMQWTEARLYQVDAQFHVVIEEITAHEGGRQRGWTVYRLDRERLEKPPPLPDLHPTGIDDPRLLEEEGFAEKWRRFDRIGNERPGFVETAEPLDTFVLRG